MTGSLRAILLLGLFTLLAACARAPLLPAETGRLPERVELTGVPFYSQDDYQCGPAALAAMLGQRGLDTSPGLLKDQVYLPGRQGSLQVEMVAAARRHGMLVYPLAPRLESVLAEVAAGNPVLVLQNLALDWWPSWHFAVVVGYDRRERQLILRSGTTRRLITDFATFDRTWAKGGRWAVLTLPANRLPATAQMHPWLQSASDLEETGQGEVAQRAYRVAVEHWPEASVGWFALANSRHAQGNPRGAEEALRESLKRDPRLAAGWFNLSEVLAERGCPAVASQARSCARQLAPQDARFAAELPAARAADANCAPVPVCPSS